MFTVDGVRKFHGWTHASLNLVLDHLSTIPANDYVREVSGFGFRTLRAQTIHIFNCEGFWVHTLHGLRYADRTLEDCPNDKFLSPTHSYAVTALPCRIQPPYCSRTIPYSTSRTTIAREVMLRTSLGTRVPVLSTESVATSSALICSREVSLTHVLA